MNPLLPEEYCIPDAEAHAFGRTVVPVRFDGYPRA